MKIETAMLEDFECDDTCTFMNSMHAFDMKQRYFVTCTTLKVILGLKLFKFVN